MEILARTIAAAGGPVWQKPQTLQLSGEARFTPYGELGRALHFDTYRMYRVFPDNSQAAHQANGKVRFDARYGEKVFFQLCFNGQQSRVDLSEVAQAYADHFKWSNNFGFGIIRFWQNPDFKIEQLVDDQVEGIPAHFIKITDATGQDTFYGIDQEEYRLRMMGFKTAIGWHHRLYSDFRAAPNGFVQAHRVRLYFDGLKWMDIDWQNCTVNAPIDSEIFD